MTLLDDLREEIFELAVKNPAGVATTCADTINNPDQRTLMQKSSLQLSCSPECDAEYDNTIGNNFCYAAQCLEESIETQRVLPGRVSELANLPSMTRDSSGEPDPRLPGILTIPSTAFKIPIYRPDLLARSVDLSLCQINGLPLLQPPQACAFSAIRPFALRRALAPLTGMALTGEEVEVESSVAQIEQIAEGIGTRVGSTLTAAYFESSVRGFAEILQNANRMIGGIGDIEISGEMCPRI